MESRTPSPSPSPEPALPTSSYRASARVREKAQRLLAGGAVRATGDGRFVVRGDSRSYVVEETAEGWTCTCPATTACSHQLAAMQMGAPA